MNTVLRRPPLTSHTTMIQTIKRESIDKTDVAPVSPKKGRSARRAKQL
jgi:hypothetical protein